MLSPCHLQEKLKHNWRLRSLSSWYMIFQQTKIHIFMGSNQHLDMIKFDGNYPVTWIFQMEPFFETTMKQLRNQAIMEYLIKWKNLPAEDSTWEDENFIQKHPKLLKHWGQHFFEGEEHVRSLYYSCNPYIVIACPI